MIYRDFVSEEPLETIRANECEHDESSLSTKRFRRLWNEIEQLRSGQCGPRQHPLNFVAEKGLLAEALGIVKDDPILLGIEATVERAIRENWNLRRLLETVGAMQISDEMWANFLYTYGWWDGRRRA